MTNSSICSPKDQPFNKNKYESNNQENRQEIDTIISSIFMAQNQQKFSYVK